MRFEFECSRSFKVTDFFTDQKAICDILLVDLALSRYVSITPHVKSKSMIPRLRGSLSNFVVNLNLLKAETFSYTLPLKPCDRSVTVLSQRTRITDDTRQNFAMQLQRSAKITVKSNSSNCAQ